VVSEMAGGGGLPAKTMVSATSGDMPIEDLRPGDRILAFTDEKLLQSEITDVFSRKTLLLYIYTDHGRLVCARTHKLLTWNGFIEAQNIKLEDELAFLKEGHRTWAKIKSIKSGKMGMVYNIETGPPHTFVANGFMVHNHGNKNGPAVPGPLWLLYLLPVLAAAASAIVLKLSAL